MKLLLSLLLAASPFIVFAQDEQSIALETATTIHIHADFSSVVVTTGGTDAIAVQHTLTVDDVDRPDLRQLLVERTGDVIHLREQKPTAKLMQREFPDRRGGQTSGGREGGKGTFNNVMVDATLKVIVPRGIKIVVETTYGGIKAINVPGLVRAHATYGPVDVVFSEATPAADLDLYSNYGAVDVTIPAGRGADLDLTTEYGELMTNMDIDVDKAASQEKQFFHRMIGSVGGGGRTITCRAPYGDVYLRKG